jgi:Ca2+-binding EF-hand superfamily protein
MAFNGEGANFAANEKEFFKQQFDLFLIKDDVSLITADGNGPQFIATTSIGNALRMCGHALTEEEIAGICTDADPENVGKVDFDVFLDCVFAAFAHLRSAEDLKDAFRAFDPDSRGLITVADMRFLLSQLGDKMSDAEINDFMAEAQSETDTEGYIVYDGLVQKFLPVFLR